MKGGFAVGIDMVEVARMRRIIRGKREHFLVNTFTARERKYCEAHRDSAPHFAGTFAAKEAVRKATSHYPAFLDLEVRRTKEGRPEIWARGRRSSSILISITHTETFACAIALKK